MREEVCWQHRDETKLQTQVDPLVMKAILETQAMKGGRGMKIAWRQRMEQRRSCMCWSNKSRKNRSWIDERMSCSRNRDSSGCNMYPRMKLCPYKLKIHPNSWHEADMVSSVVDRMQGNAAACMSLCASMRSHPFSTLTKAKTKSKSN